MATYAELLQDQKWKNKRSEILDRDKKVCQNCQNDHYYSNFKKSEVIHIECLDDYMLMALNAGDSRFRDGVYKYSVQFLDEDDNKQRIEFFTTEYVKNTTRVKTHNLFYKKLTTTDLNNDSSKFEIICINNPEKSNDVFFCKDLHVHHKYYQKGRNPWEYPNEALTTLCWHCHEELHENTEVDIYDESGKFIEKRSPCYKCHGAGSFSEYSHVQNGICFVCNGARFK
jgi:5-methylcytosine-specific restriction endonuclease McrA